MCYKFCILKKQLPFPEEFKITVCYKFCISKNCRSRDCKCQNTCRLQQREICLQDPVFISFYCFLNLNLWAGILLIDYHLEAISLPCSDNILVKVDQSICRTCVWNLKAITLNILHFYIFFPVEMFCGSLPWVRELKFIMNYSWCEGCVFCWKAAQI